MTKYNGRTNLAKEVEEMAQQIANQLDTIVFSSKIRNGVVVAEAPAHGESLLKYAPKSNPCLDYMEFISEIIRLTNPADSF